MNPELLNHKTGLIGELLVRIYLNDLGINTGSVDNDTGTDIILFYNGKSMTAQVKSSLNNWNNNSDIHGVGIHFKVKIVRQNDKIQIEKCEIKWKQTPGDVDFKPLNDEILNVFN